MVIRALRFYQSWISPYVGAHCRFHPSCSEYAAQAVAKYGVWHGGWLALKRVGRCHPWHRGGYDPVP
ncbi:membrane protein insertion efficiency factor YidD [Moorellaceae bacterium AZ2]